MLNKKNTMQIRCYIMYHLNNTKIKSIQSTLFQCLFYTNKALNLGHLEKYLNRTNTKGSPHCDGLETKKHLNEKKTIDCHKKKQEMEKIQKTYNLTFKPLKPYPSWFFHIRHSCLLKK
jgi:hypothetical protein